MVQTATRTHCPTCGARLARPELSICAYCAAPLGLEEEVREPTETMRRLERIAEHDKYPDAMAWEPPPEIEDLAATSLASRGLLMVGFGVFFLLLALPWTLLLGGSLLWAWATAPGIAGLLLAALGTVLWLVARSRIAAARAVPLLRRPALVTSRRSETAIRGGGYSTIYHFQLEFADGSAGEFRYPGRGVNHDLLVGGNTGVALTRGDLLVAFHQIRV
jgi:hypothetical protein